MTGRVWVTEGVVSARVEPGSLIDAAVSGEMAGLEFEVADATVHFGPRTDYRSDCTLSLSMRPHTMETLLTVLADKLQLPAFNSREWNDIADMLADAPGPNATQLAQRIREALKR